MNHLDPRPRQRDSLADANPPDEETAAFFSMTFFMIIYAIYRTTSPGVVVFPIVFCLTFVAAVDEQPVLLIQPGSLSSLSHIRESTGGNFVSDIFFHVRTV